MTGCLHQYRKVGEVELRPCSRGYKFDYEKNDCIGKFNIYLQSTIKVTTNSVSITYFAYNCRTASSRVMCKLQTENLTANLSTISLLIMLFVEWLLLIYNTAT